MIPLVVAIVVCVTAASIVGSPAKTAHAATSYSAEELALVGLLNQYRAAHALGPLLVSDEVSQACERHSSDMAGYGFVNHYTTAGSHWFKIGASPWDRMAASGYSYNTYKGENIAAGYATAAAVLTAWEESPAHNSVMLNPHFTVVGISMVHTDSSIYRYYWTADFGGFVDSSAHPVDTRGAAAEAS